MACTSSLQYRLSCSGGIASTRRWCRTSSVGEVARVQVGVGVGYQSADVGPVGPVHAVAQPLAGSSVFSRAQEVSLDLDVVEHALTEGHQALARGRARPERRRPADEALLEAPLALVEQGAHQAAAVAEVAKQCALAHSRGARDLVHRYGVGASQLHQALGCLQDRAAVARRVCSLVPKRFEHGQCG
jgi:hypothetical protein